MKEKITNFFDKVNPWFDKLGRNPYLQAISNAMMATLGPVFIGSISVLIIVLMNMNNSLAKMTGIINLLGKMNTVTLGATAIYVTILMAYHLVRKLDENEDAITAAIISLISFLIITPLGQTTDDVAAIPTTWLGAQGMFSAIIIGIVSAKIFLAIKHRGWTIKMPDGVPPMVTRMFEGLIPTILIGIFFGLVSFGFSATSFSSMHQFVFSIIQEPLKGIGGSIGAVIILSLLQQILWFFGIHGTNVIMPIATPLWMAMDMENLAAIQAGLTPPNIVGLAFFNIITWSGLGLGLVILMLRAKSKQYREVGKIALVPSLFGITEPLIFGAPLVLNFDLAIPFITNNTIALILSYVLTKIGIVAKFTGVQAIFGLPVGFHAAVQGSISIILLQLFIQLILSPILWYPWFKRLDNKTYKMEIENSVEEVK
ncbi:PTS sugar transporter subunit IIC [Vagococcus fluvialis]|uniref:PTS sugar transporter subunit IIC n=1 Tax=Vagococcus fluvialis TaxID=2738 RepID=UPI001D0A87BC|nr:PTS transporter subunit EIIC [Vagococcus fluvialis]UDM71812.1 PTS transporter subunit EIIC [Vagococcus fluvialis]UDM76677.1 PTS transporter subunit EIIC [Vagococcus fluvialis]UDM83506.1 PTS transporter subunit EIIC [Vagococcus fluvialis]